MKKSLILTNIKLMGTNLSQSYYLRDLMQEDWKMFHELDKKIFADEPLT